MPAFIDITDQRFGRLKVLKRGEDNKQGRARWKCLCDCGAEKLINAKSLRSGLSTSCGCRSKEVAAKRVVNLIGMKFGRLTVISRSGSRGGQSMWQCTCDCGGSKRADGVYLRNGSVSACGCTRGNPTHGHTREGISPTYRSWTSMIARCTQPSNPSFKYYERKGITICQQWRKFENFLADMGERPSLEFSIDRHPNNDGNYEPGNCRWATKREQANNRVTNVMFTYKGQEMAFADLVRATGLGKEFLRHRLLRAGWSVEEAVSKPPTPGERRDLI